MPDLAALANDIKGLPDQALQSELTHPTGLVPSYLVLAEAQRRQLMRQAAQKQQGQQSGSVYQDVIRNMMARQPPPGPPAPAGMTPSSNAPPQPGATPPQNFSPPKTMAEGGSVDDEDSGDSGDSGDGEQPNDLVQKLGQAIYRMEGSQPNSLATRNNNPGNLRSAGDQSGSSGGYAVFPDMDTGWEALHRQIQKNIDRGLTLKEFFAGKPGVYDGYAPAADKNQPLQYAANVADWTGIDPDTPLSSQIASRKSAPPASADTTPLASNPFMGPLTPPTGLAAANQAVQQPASDQDTSVSQPAPTTAAPSRPVRRPIDDEIARLDAQIGQQQDQLNKPSRNNVQDLQENIRAILPALGYSPDALQNMEQRAYSSKATIQALQADALNRYHKRDPWTYLSNLAAGMADSKSVLLPQMLAHGAAYAANAQDEAREKALSDWDALNKESQTIDNNIGSLHERLSTAVGGLLERQTNANAVDQQRRLAEIERLQKNRQDLLLKSQSPTHVTGDAALIAISKGYDPNNLTAAQAQDVLKEKKPTGQDVLSDIDPKIVKLSDSLAPGQRNDALLATQPPGEQAIVRQLVDYKLAAPTGIALKQPEWQKRIALAAAYDPTFDASLYGTRQKLRSDFMSGKSSQAISALNTVTGHLDRLEQNWQSLANYGGWKTPLNMPANWIAERSGDPRIKPFVDDQEAVANELMRVWRQVGASDAEIKEWKKGLDINAAPAEQQSTIKEMYNLIGGKLEALKSQYETGMGRPTDFHMLTPAAQKRFAAHGVDASELAPGASYGSSQPPGAATAPVPGKYMHNNREIIPQGGKWVYKDTGQGVSP